MLLLPIETMTDSTNMVEMGVPPSHVTCLLIPGDALLNAGHDARVEDAEHVWIWSEAGTGHALRCGTPQAVQRRPHCCGIEENYGIDRYSLSALGLARSNSSRTPCGSAEANR